MSESTIDVDRFRHQAREWLDANLERWPDPDLIPPGGEDPSPADVAAGRVIQRRLFDAGYAGITYPTEYGGAGLTAAHERAFNEESEPFVMPQFGGAGRVMFTAIGRSLLDHATPEFLQRHIPPLLAGERSRADLD